MTIKTAPASLVGRDRNAHTHGRGIPIARHWPKYPLATRMSPWHTDTRAFAFYCLCALLLLNPTIAEAGYLLRPQGIAGLSVMQWFQGLMLLLELLLLLVLYRSCKETRRLEYLGLSFAISALMFLSRNVFDPGSSLNGLREDLVMHSKYIFWVCTWLFAAMTVRTVPQAATILTCIVCGAAVDALFKIVGSTTGMWEVDVYTRAGVSASFGAEGISGKATLGFLLPSVFLSWICLRHRPWLAALLSCLFSVAICMTLNRASQVALCASILWCIFWVLFVSSRHGSTRVCVRFLVLFGVGACLYLANYGTEALTARWTREYEKKSGLTGSGRLIFYGTAWESFQSAKGLDLVFGRGIKGTKDVMELAVGSRVHTHSDVFDMMSFGGMWGLWLYAYMMYVLIRHLRGLCRTSLEYEIAVAVGISFTVMSFVTGQMGAPHAMIVVGVSLWCLRVIGRSRALRHGPIST